MKKIIKIGLLAILAINLSIIFTSECFASEGTVTGAVEYYRVHNKTTYSTTWAPPMFWVTLKDVTSAGACTTWHDTVLFVATSKEELALVISSATSGHALSVYYNDSDLVNGYCRIQYMTAGNPPPPSS